MAKLDIAAIGMAVATPLVGYAAGSALVNTMTEKVDFIKNNAQGENILNGILLLGGGFLMAKMKQTPVKALGLGLALRGGSGLISKNTGFKIQGLMQPFVAGTYVAEIPKSIMEARERAREYAQPMVDAEVITTTKHVA